MGVGVILDTRVKHARAYFKGNRVAELLLKDAVQLLEKGSFTSTQQYYQSSLRHDSARWKWLVASYNLFLALKINSPFPICAINVLIVFGQMHIILSKSDS